MSLKVYDLLVKMSAPKSVLSKDQMLYDYWYSSSSENDESVDEIIEWFFGPGSIYKQGYI